MTPTQVFICDDNKFARDSLRELVERLDNFAVCGTASDGAEAFDAIVELEPDIALVDVGLPLLNGIDLARKLQAARPRIRIVAISAYGDAVYVSSMFDAGAIGFVTKEHAFEDLATALTEARSGKVFISQAIAPLQSSEQTPFASEDGALPDGLTARERQVLQALVEGKRNREIALHLGISVKTVETHRSRIMKKLNATSVADLVRYAMRQGFTYITSDR